MKELTKYGCLFLLSLFNKAKFSDNILCKLILSNHTANTTELKKVDTESWATQKILGTYQQTEDAAFSEQDLSLTYNLAPVFL